MAPWHSARHHTPTAPHRHPHPRHERLPLAPRLQPTTPPRTRLHPRPRRLQADRMPRATAIIRPRGQCITHFDDHLVPHHVHGAIDPAPPGPPLDPVQHRSEEHTSELTSLMRTSYDVFCFEKKTTPQT